MSYITPNSTVRIYSNAPFDPLYDHTVYWMGGTVAARLNNQKKYFNGENFDYSLIYKRPSDGANISISESVTGLTPKYTLTAQSYQRAGKGKIRVQLSTDNLYDCNYIAFQNTAYNASRWFYAFMTGVDYINDHVAEISYEIDVIQTWFFDITLQRCLIDREHQSTDEIGDNLVPENVELGEYVSNNGGRTTYISGQGYDVIVAATFDKDYEPGVGGQYCGVYSGLVYNKFSIPSELNDLNNFFEGLGAKADGVVAVYYVPHQFTTPTNNPFTQDPDTYASFIQTKPKWDGTTQAVQTPNIDGYAPKNKKLFTYPYNFLYVSNLQGGAAVYRYEDWRSDSECRFLLAGDYVLNASNILIPINYKDIAVNYDEAITLSGWPQCAWISDTFKAWLANNTPSIAAGSISGLMALGASAMVAPIAAPLAVAGVASYALNTLAKVSQAEIQPNHAHGTSTSNLLVTLQNMDFQFYHKHIKAEFAEIIDNYFSAYGYACHKVKIPNLSARREWTFTKTIGCKIRGNMPADDEAKVCEIFDKGITFWNCPDHIGQYQLDNQCRVG